MSSISLVSIHQWWRSDFNHFLKIFPPLPLLMVCVAVAVPPARVQEAGSQLPSVWASPGEVQEPLCEWNTVSSTDETVISLSVCISFHAFIEGQWWSVTLCSQDKRNIAFMQELRCLFALMVGSTRRFVDPSAAVELLRDAFRTSEAQQVQQTHDMTEKSCLNVCNNHRSQTLANPLPFTVNR